MVSIPPSYFSSCYTDMASGCYENGKPKWATIKAKYGEAMANKVCEQGMTVSAFASELMSADSSCKYLEDQGIYVKDLTKDPKTLQANRQLATTDKRKIAEENGLNFGASNPIGFNKSQQKGVGEKFDMIA